MQNNSFRFLLEIEEDNEETTKDNNLNESLNNSLSSSDNETEEKEEEKTALTSDGLKLHKQMTSASEQQDKDDDCTSIATSCVSLSFTGHGKKRSKERFVTKKLLQKTKKNGVKTDSKISDDIFKINYEGCVALFSKENGKLITTYFDKKFKREKLEESCKFNDPLSLFAACHFGQPELLAKLIIAGADIFIKDDKDRSPFVIALKQLEKLLKRNLTYWSIKRIKKFIRKTNKEGEIAVNNYFNCVKYYRAALEVKHIIKSDLKVKIGPEVCIKVMNLEELKYFINLFGHKDINGGERLIPRKRSVFMSACLHNRLDVVKYLFENYDALDMLTDVTKDGSRFTALFYACFYGNVNVVEFLIHYILDNKLAYLLTTENSKSETPYEAALCYLDGVCEEEKKNKLKCAELIKNAREQSKQ
ncbi:hypothetical protein ABK040_008983 [Willaertia magna]